MTRVRLVEQSTLPMDKTPMTDGYGPVYASGIRSGLNIFPRECWTTNREISGSNFTGASCCFFLKQEMYPSRRRWKWRQFHVGKYPTIDFDLFRVINGICHCLLHATYTGIMSCHMSRRRVKGHILSSFSWHPPTYRPRRTLIDTDSICVELY